MAFFFFLNHYFCVFVDLIHFTFTLFVLLFWFRTFPNLKGLKFLELFFELHILVSPSVVYGADGVRSCHHWRPTWSSIWALWHHSLTQHDALPRPGQYPCACTPDVTKVLMSVSPQKVCKSDCDTSIIWPSMCLFIFWICATQHKQYYTFTI